MSDSLELDDVVKMAPHYRLRWEEAQSRYVVLYPEGIVQLNDTAGEILERCADAGSVASIVEEMQTLYPDEAVEADVRAFLEEAIANGWVTRERT